MAAARDPESGSLARAPGGAPAASAPLREVLGPEGTLSRNLPGYEYREEQLAMAREVEQALSGRRYLVVEAGTGTGKTLAYLVPAALSGRRVVVSTATRALQDQLWSKDLPLLAEAAGLPVKAALLKGRSNYYCRERGGRFAERPTFPTQEDAALYPRLLEWAATTATGDLGEVDLPDAWSARREVSATSETCLGKDCPLYQECFVTLARARAAEADVVLVNHHLFFADLAMRTGPAGAEVLPAYEAVVFDEAHALEDVATDWFGLAASSFKVEELARDAVQAVADRPDLARLVKGIADELRAAGDRFFEHLAERALGESSPSPRGAGRGPGRGALARAALPSALGDTGAEAPGPGESAPVTGPSSRRCRSPRRCWRASPTSRRGSTRRWRRCAPPSPSATSPRWWPWRGGPPSSARSSPPSPGSPTPGASTTSSCAAGAPSCARRPSTWPRSW